MCDPEVPTLRSDVSEAAMRMSPDARRLFERALVQEDPSVTVAQAIAFAHEGRSAARSALDRLVTEVQDLRSLLLAHIAVIDGREA